MAAFYRLNYTSAILSLLVIIPHGWQTIAQDPVLLKRPRRYDLIQTLCDEEKCVKIGTSTLLNYYDGLFHTQEEIDDKLKEWATLHREKYGQTRPGSFLYQVCKDRYYASDSFCTNFQTQNQDFDLCCPTSFYHTPNVSMVNIRRQRKVLVTLQNPERKQFVPYARCLASGACFESLGSCQTDTIEIPLLVVDTEHIPPCKFDTFSVPAYCSCKSN